MEHTFKLRAILDTADRCPTLRARLIERAALLASQGDKTMAETLALLLVSQKARGAV